LKLIGMLQLVKIYWMVWFFEGFTWERITEGIDFV